MARLAGDPKSKPRKRFGFARSQPGARDPNAADRRSDLTIAALGVTLGLICALFPWYIFLNQEKFGVRAMKFAGSRDQQPMMSLSGGPDRIGAPMSPDDFEPLTLDLFATGTTPATSSRPKEKAPGIDEQPFPAEKVVYHVVHITNGRAMIEDDSGLFLVQPGATLPDNSQVTSIEQRDGRWVVVTSDDQVLEIAK